MMDFIWVTRGRNWGSRFLRSGGADEPFALYESAFRGVEQQAELWRRFTWAGRPDDAVALRFTDPEARTDRAGRLISHDFVICGPPSTTIDSLEKGLAILWPRVRDEYATIWAGPSPTP